MPSYRSHDRTAEYKLGVCCMRIVHAEFYGLKYLHAGVAKIRRLVLTPTSLAQIIIGTNGAGKSRLMHELTVLPARRPDYLHDGYKKITAVDAEGIEYLVTSDFTKKSSPHSLYRLSDNTELNPGGTEEAQDDLVAQIFGIDRRKSDLLYHRTAVSRMTAATRKDWLVSLNPVSLGFIFERHRYVLGQIKACKNQLTLLIARKATLEADLLDSSLCEKLSTESVALSDEIAKLVEYGHRLGERITSLHTTPPIDTEQVAHQIAAYRASIREIRRRHRLYDEVDRSSDAALRMRQHEQEAAAQHAAIVALEEQAYALASDVDRYDTALRKLAESGSLSEIDEAIATITRQLAELPVVTDPDWSAAAINEAPTTLAQFRDLCTQFGALDGVLYPRAVYERKYRAVQYHHRRLMQIERELERRESDIVIATQNLEAYQQPIPEPCAKAHCPLYLQFSTRQTSLRTELQTHTTQRDHLLHIRGRVTRYVTEQTQKLETTTALGPDLKKLTALLNLPQNSHLRQALVGIDLIQRLQINPGSLCVILDATYEAALTIQRRRRLEHDLGKYLQQRETAVVTGSAERDALQTILTEKQSALIQTRTRISTNTRIHAATLQKIQQYADYLADLAAFVTLGQEIDDLLKQCQKAHDHQQLQHLQQTLAEYRQDTVRRLSGIERTLREQYTLQERYTLEVLGQITVIEARKHDLQLVEAALADIPQIYMIRFLNSILHTANQLIKEVFSYPLAFQLHTEDKSLDYKLPVRNSGETVPDVAECSTAQKAMLNFAFNAAVAIQLKLTNCPIWLDEIGEGFDHHHEQKLIQLLSRMVNAKQFSQLFLVNHHAIIHGGFAHADVLVLDDSNVLTPNSYNTHAIIEKEV